MKSVPKKAPKIQMAKSPNGNYMREYDKSKKIPILRKRQLVK